MSDKITVRPGMMLEYSSGVKGVEDPMFLLVTSVNVEKYQCTVLWRHETFVFSGSMFDYSDVPMGEPGIEDTLWISLEALS